MTQETPRNHDHSGRGSGGKELRPELVSTDQARIGEDLPDAPRRPEVTNGDMDINVPGDYTTIQEAVNAVPYKLRHEVNITVDPGTYNEDVIVWPTVMGGLQTSGTGERLFDIFGDGATPSNVQVDSFYVLGTIGKSTPVVNGFETLKDSSPYDEDTRSAACAYGCHGVSFRNILPQSSSTAAAYFYESKGELVQTNVTSPTTTVSAKRYSEVTVKEMTGTNGVAAYENSTIGVVTGSPGGLFSADSTSRVYDGARYGGTVAFDGDTRFVPGTQTTVGTDATVIGPCQRVAFYLIVGVDGGDRFADLVAAAAFNGATVASSNTASGTPAGRTYTVTDTDLELEMASSSYEVTVMGVAGSVA